MGLFGFLEDIASATIKTALSPIAVVKDAVDVVTGEEPKSCRRLFNSVSDDLSDAADEIMP